MKHKRLHPIFKQLAIWDAIVSDCPRRLCVYKHVTFCLLMSLGCPLNTLSHCISQVGLLTAGSAAVGGSPLIETSTVVTDGQMQSALFAISSSNRKENLVVSIDSDFLTEGFHTISKASAKWTS